MRKQLRNLPGEPALRRGLQKYTAAKDVREYVLKAAACLILRNYFMIQLCSCFFTWASLLRNSLFSLLDGQ